MDVIKSIGYDQIEMIQDIIKLHVPQGYIDLDPTYSKGNFYKSGVIQDPEYKFDLNPQTEDTQQGCATELPIKSDNLRCIMFDPPFLATTGKSLKKSKGNIINKRFGVFSNEKELHKFYKKSLEEFYRVLNNNGVLIFKCQDKISSGKQYLSHCIIIQQALDIGFYPKDLFVLLAKNRLIANWQRNQIHCRKFHSYFLVFEKRKSKVKYKELI